MEHVILVIHLILTLMLIGLILIQKSEGGGLGLGTGGGMGSFASAQSTKNAITKTTTIVAICFFTTSLILGIMASRTDRSKSILDAAPVEASSTTAPNATSTTAPNVPPSVPVAGTAAAQPTSAPTAAAKKESDAPKPALGGDTKKSEPSKETPKVPLAK